MDSNDLTNIILYGAGTQNLRMAYQPIVSAGYKVKAICDKDPAKQGKQFYGVEIVSPEALEKLENFQREYILVITIRTKTIVEAVRRDLGHLKYASIYSFEEFIEYAKLNCRVKRFSCVMTHLVDHCNLNCVRCSHFSPLETAHKFYLDPVMFEKDCRRLSALTGDSIDEFQLSGGETLLHPQSYLFPGIVRKFFPHTQVIMITNGTLLLKQDERFWRSCREHQVQIWLPKYPIDLDFEKIIWLLEKKGVQYEIGNSGNSDDHPKEMWGLPLCLEGGLDRQRNFECCLCMQYILRDGWVYPCANSAYIDLFNNYFKKTLPGPNANGVNIYKVSSLEELTSKISQPVPLCEYCDAQHRMAPIPWAVSKKEIGEWVKE